MEVHGPQQWNSLDFVTPSSISIRGVLLMGIDCGFGFPRWREKFKLFFFPPIDLIGF